EPVPEQEGAAAEEREAAPQGAAPDPRDATIAQQAGRIDELMRGYATLIEDGKAGRARLEREKTRVLEAERAQVAQALLEAVDELERALGAAGNATGPLVDGVRLTLGSLAKKVSELGAQRIQVVGLRYDPHLAEAVDLVPVSDASQDDVVVQEVRAGYRIGDRVLRPARVRVGRLAQT
ncbi:MAG TPA: nucleotide exchange factor GrpE, partial [Anaeromyxobacteraceae bacterium]